MNPLLTQMLGESVSVEIQASEDGTEVIFKADTPEGEEYLGTQEMTVATSEAAEFKKRAEKAELIVIAFP